MRVNFQIFITNISLTLIPSVNASILLLAFTLRCKHLKQHSYVISTRKYLKKIGYCKF